MAEFVVNPIKCCKLKKFCLSKLDQLYTVCRRVRNKIQTLENQETAKRKKENSNNKYEMYSLSRHRVSRCVRS